MLHPVLRQVFSEGRYVVLASAAALVTFVMTTWLANLNLVWEIAISNSMALGQKFKILAALIGSIGTNFTVFSALMAITISILFGVSLALVVYDLRYWRAARGASAGATAAGLSGLMSGLLGIGCAACGSFLLSPVLVFLGLGTLLPLLPLGGEELGLVGIAMLVMVIILYARRIGRQGACLVLSGKAVPSNERRTSTATVDQ
jgi:hypothetical protein